jgi:hypothetical protein
MEYIRVIQQYNRWKKLHNNRNDLRNYLIVLTVLPFLLACNNRNNVAVERFCFVDYDSLLHSLDTSRIEISSFGQDSIEVRDTSVKNGEGSVFHFDSKGRLGLYAFMVDWPLTNFMILYDSNGRKRRIQENEVVQWRYTTPKTDSNLKLTVLLCAVDRNYGNLKLSAGKYCDSSIHLFETTYSKIIYFESSVPVDKKKDSIKIYLRGEAMEKCTRKRFFFIDSTTVGPK